MSFKDLFDGATRASAIANKSAKEIGAEVESVGYHTQDIINENRFIPNVDFNDPSTFARYGSAEEYYGQSIERVYDTYPYDGSLKERLEWENSSTYIDLYLLDNQYPRTNGYVLLSANGWGSGGSLSGDGYSLPASTEYIYFKGGPHPNPDGMTPYSNAFTGSNYYEPDANRASNLKFDLTGSGVTVEFWFKKDAWVGNQTKEVVLDLWNGVTSGSATYGRLRVAFDPTADGTNPIIVTARSGAVGPIEENIGSSLTIADSAWHHYAISFASVTAGIATKLYVDGTLNTESTLGIAGINEVTGALRAQIGALITDSDIAPAAPQYAGKLSGSLDEFRYWKTRRTSKDVGRYWFTQVGGGTNSDPTPYSDTQETVNTNLGVYFKFNEGITGEAATDSTVLDYSGRVSNGTWTGYTNTSRNTGSAIVLSNAAIKEFKDPIIYSFHPDVVNLKSELESSGSSYDDSNSTSIYKSIPGWITEDDDAGQHQLKNLTQIVSSYFDTLHMQIAEHNKLKDIEYVSGSNKPFPYSNKLLNSQGFVSPNIFVDADLFEQLADRSEDKLYEKSLSEIKNIIYQNIYNNLSYIYKTKGTEKAFRNLIRCYGIDDELIKLSMYAKNTNYEFRENRRTLLVGDRTVNFNHPTNTNATVYSFSSSANPNSTGYIAASTNLTGGYAVTLEADIFFPQKPSEGEAYGYFNTNAISSSLFGVHQARTSQTDTGWGNGSENEDATNFQVFSVRDELDSSNVRFTLTGTAGGYVPYLTSELYEDVYADTSWNLSTRIRPERFPLATYVSGADTGDYVVELHGVQTRAGEIINTFTVSASATAGDTDWEKSFMTGSRRVFLGAHRENITGSTIYETSDVRVNSCRFWIDYVEDAALAAHALDTENYGPRRPGRYASPWDKTAAGTGEITALDTLAFNWEFSENTGSNALGKFSVADESSGSATLAASRYGFIGTLAGKQITAQGQGFVTSSTDAVKKEFVVVSRLNELEVIAPSEMVTVLGVQEQQVFKVDSRPVNYFFAFEKSMSKVVSEAMVNAFGTLSAFNTLIGKPVNRFRNEYKDLKFLRQKFYEKVGNDEIDFDKFYEFYKWFDSSLSYMLGQLVPASADFAQNIRTTIESTVLERSKYRNVFPFLEQPANDFTSSIGSNVDYGDSISSPDDDPQGTGFYPVHAPTRRSVGLTPRSLLQKWKYDHAPEDLDQKKNHLWWRDRAERNNPTITETTGVDETRAAILQSIREQTKRSLATPYRFSMAGSRVLGGVGQHQNKDVNFTFQATQPYGPTIDTTNIPLNIMLSFDSDVEALLDTTDEFYPVYKQRLGFGIDPGINRDDHEDLYLKNNGNKIAPFSLYESSENTGYQSEVSSSYKPGVAITNLHHDFVADTDIPLQGPFTEKYVGGRSFRHTDINSGPILDTRTTRAEGFRITLGAHTGSSHSGSLGIVPPNYPFPDTAPGDAPLGWVPSLPTAQRFRDETAKRPVNIRNIQMRTGSTILGNYEKNYQVIQTSGRTLNDPFFNDQSFDFALHPQLPIRGLSDGRVTNNKAVSIDQTNRYTFAAASEINDYGEETIVTWINTTNPGSTNRLLWDVGARWIQMGSTEVLQYAIFTDGSARTFTTSNPITTGNEWVHLAITYKNGGASAGDCAIYINGEPVETSDYAGTGTDGTWSSTVYLGYAAASGFTGYISDFAIWRVALTAAEIADLYNNSNVNLTGDGLAGFGPHLSDLLYWYRMGDGTGDTAAQINNQAPGAAAANPMYDYNSPTIIDISPSDCARGLNNLPLSIGYARKNFALPNRTGANSNQTVIASHFSAPGDYKTLSRGYLDPAHEELSVYNASPYRNRDIIDYGLSGSASVDPSLASTIRVQDQLNKVRGLDQRASLHCGPFGSDAAYGTVPELTYVTQPSWHKTNRNRRQRMESGSAGYATASVYDNLYVQHQIPRSERQYAWITGSMLSGTTIYGLDAASCVSASSLSQLVTGASNTYYGEAYLQNFVGQAGRLVVDSVNDQAHLQHASEYSPLDVGTYSAKFIGEFAAPDYFPSPFVTIGPSDVWTAAIFNASHNIPYTISVWFYATDAPGNPVQTLIAWGGPTYWWKKIIFNRSSRMVLFSTSEGDSGVSFGSIKSTAGGIEINKWHHVVVTYDGTDPAGSNTEDHYKIYVDGVEDTTVLNEVNNADHVGGYPGRLAVGSDTTPGAEPLTKVYMADVAIWNDDLLSGDVTTLYNDGRPIDPSLYPDQSNFIALYRFDAFSSDSTTVIPNRAPYAPINSDGSGSKISLTRFSPNSTDGLNILLNNRAGRFGWPTWKQIRTGETKTASRLRRTNKIGTILPPPFIPQDATAGRTYQYVRGKQANTFVDYTEQPISSRYKPTMVCLEDNTEEANVANNLSLNIAYGNMLDHFSNQGLNNRLNVPVPNLYNNALNTVFEYVTGSDLTVIVDYSERLYPAETNAYKNIIRRRTSYNIDNIWNSSRPLRSAASGGIYDYAVDAHPQGQPRSQGPGLGNVGGSPWGRNSYQSIWPLDGHSDFTVTSSVLMNDGAGELMNSYSRYVVQKYNGDPTVRQPAATYAPRIPIGSSSVTSGSDQVYAGDSEYLVAQQAGKQPYETYENYSAKIALAGKDHSLIPEFRISEHIATYIDQNESDFLIQLDNVFSLTGAAIADSSESGFYKTYSNSDFLKYFSIVDESLNNERPGNLKIKRDKVSLKCSGLLKFLPYKGFYPAERTLQLATLFSQSYAPYMSASLGGATSSVQFSQAWTTALEPFFAPGIMYNTIKSGIACGYAVLANTASTMTETALGGSGGIPTANSLGWTPNSPVSASLFEGTVSFEDFPYLGDNTPLQNRGFVLQRLPFEALADPVGYLGGSNLTGSGGIFDTGVSSYDKIDNGWGGPIGVQLNPGGELYKYAIDNFLCETTEFFLDGLGHFESNREDQFQTVVSGSQYKMRLKLYRSSQSPTGSQVESLDISAFNMYTRETAFGYPLSGIGGYPRMDHQTPPYWSGSADALITFTAQYTGIPTLDEVFNNLSIEYSRDISTEILTGKGMLAAFRQQIDSCFNITDYFNDVPAGTVTQAKRWLIQSKFETPVTNLAGAVQASPPTSYTYSTAGSAQLPTTAAGLNTTGLWHQYGTVPEQSNEGIFVVVEQVYDGTQENLAAPGATAQYRSTQKFPSLADIVGFPTGQPRRIGSVKKESILEEAVVAIPFKSQKNRRNFIDVAPDNVAYQNITEMLEKYVFPPRFDFIRNATVDPILMYTFEFSAKLSQKDIADMWQNLPPDLASKFEQKDVVVEETELLDSLMNSTENIQWMVFKVKKRAQANYQQYRRSLVSEDVSALQEVVGDYSYNWPYDFFSLIELAKIDETVRYASDDLTEAVTPPSDRGATRRGQARTLPAPSRIPRVMRRDDAPPQVGTQTIAVADAAGPVATPSPTKRRGKVAKPAKKSTKRRSTKIGKAKKR